MNKQESMFQDLKQINAHCASLLLLLFLTTDLVFIGLHVINAITPFPNAFLFNITMDHSYPEMYQYIKFFWVIILFAYLLKSTKCYSYVSWILVFTYFLFDDSLKIHEVFGQSIAKNFNFTPFHNFRIQDFGELAASAFAGTFLLAILGGTYLKGSPTFRKVSVDMLIFFMALAFFGVFVDLAKHAIPMNREVSFGFGIVEDGGEMVVVSLTLWYVILLAIRKGDSDLYLHDLIRKFLARRFA